MKMAYIVGRPRKDLIVVSYGIKWLQELNHIFIDPLRCPNVWREFTSAEYERDKFGNVTTKIPDGDDHTIDSCRYATEEYWNNLATVSVSKGKVIK
jgi:phage terminase large subunit